MNLSRSYGEISDDVIEDILLRRVGIAPPLGV